MDFRTITDTSSKQYELQEKSVTNEKGFRTYQGRKLIAIANYEVGTYLDLKLDDDTVIKVIVGDIKANTSCLHGDGSLIEFIVDTNIMNSEWLALGDLSVAYKGNIKLIKEYL